MQLSLISVKEDFQFSMWNVTRDPVLLFTVGEVFCLGLSSLTVEGSTTGNSLSSQAACFWNNAEDKTQITTLLSV